ncbi:MAG TPA: enoyl-CoA hydratase/isomerase family protein [Gammaproteobacteria bacterium]|nr:enoyl-CoA hydratase/isomerase family protein [Gammaproteobacteria bacterium]
MIECGELAPGIAGLTLNRPPANALSPELLAELTSALERTARDGARAIVIAGQPGMFSAGLDVPLLLTLRREEMREFWRTFYAALHALARSPVPVLIAITGHCPAGGTVLALFADCRIAAEGDFKLGLNEVQVGLPMPPLVFGAFRRLVGAQAAAGLAVSAQLIPPEEALRIGLVDEIVSPDRVVTKAVDKAQTLASLPAGALAATRALARADLLALFDAVTDATYAEMNEVWFGAETQGAMRALVARLAERRAAASR